VTSEAEWARVLDGTVATFQRHARATVSEKRVARA
jgi:hypothetical protein